MLALPDDKQEDRTSYPTQGARIGINYHDQTLGKHRVRFSFDQPIVEVLRRGLSFPRCHIDGSFVNGLRIWCTEQDGMAPTLSKTGGWSFSVPVRRVRAREDLVHSAEVEILWERDQTGPVLLIPRLPDTMLPEVVIEKLPNSQVDMSTIMSRAETRLMREMNKMLQDAREDTEAAEDTEALGHDPVMPVPKVDPTADLGTPAEIPAVEPPSAPALDLREALAMVNELVDQLGDSVVLSIDAHGHVTAKRRIVSFIDL
jgi:hypothetical protein